MFAAFELLFSNTTLTFGSSLSCTENSLDLFELSITPVSPTFGSLSIITRLLSPAVLLFVTLSVYVMESPADEVVTQLFDVLAPLALSFDSLVIIFTDSVTDPVEGLT